MATQATESKIRQIINRLYLLAAQCSEDQGLRSELWGEIQDLEITFGLDDGEEDEDAEPEAEREPLNSRVFDIDAMKELAAMPAARAWLQHWVERTLDVARDFDGYDTRLAEFERRLTALEQASK